MASIRERVRHEPVRTHGGAIAAQHVPLELQLRRSVCSCLLWEDEFYESGKTIADRIQELARQAPPAAVARLAIEARRQFHLRHVPLLLCSVLARTGSGTSLVSDTLAQVVSRADELSEFLAVYAKVNGVKLSDLKKKVSAQVKKGLGRALARFDEYQLAKYFSPGAERGQALKIRDVIYITHPAPKDAAQAALWKRLLKGEEVEGGEVKSADTWEVGLSTGKDPKEVFERQLRQQKLGYLALIRNLRKMQEVGVDEALVTEAILARRGGADRVLPFRFITAAKAEPRFEGALDQAMVANLAQVRKLPGKTIVIVDVSGSMYGSYISGKSDVTRAHVACSMAAIARELCEQPVIYATAGNDSTRVHQTALVPARCGMALVDAIFAMCRPLGGGGIFLKQAIDFVREKENTADRIIVVTDEQDCSIGHMDAPTMADPFGAYNYLINVASAKNGIGYGKWTHVDGFSEHVFDFMREVETLPQ